MVAQVVAGESEISALSWSTTSIGPDCATGAVPANAIGAGDRVPVRRAEPVSAWAACAMMPAPMLGWPELHRAIEGVARGSI